MKKSRTWRQLVQSDRDRIQLRWEAGEKQKDIAHILEVSPSRISREINGRKRLDGTYNATDAGHKAQVARSRSKYQGMKIEQQPLLRQEIISQLKQSRSPDEIAGRMIRENWPVRVSADAIYRWLRSPFGQRYCRYLCTKRYYKKPSQGTTKRHLIPNLVSIHDILEPVGVVTEGDTFVSPKKASKASAVLVGWRECKLLKGERVPSLRPIHTTRVMQRIHLKHPSDLLILDQGIENIYHEQFGVRTGFCDPASPRQKPFIESSIGLARRWFWSKGTNLAEVSSEEFQAKIEILNNKYRKSLRYRSANEVARECGILK
jgi:transposase, IS30 family